MSSMFKKKTGLAFKPKAPAARRAANVSSTAQPQPPARHFSKTPVSTVPSTADAPAPTTTSTSTSVETPSAPSPVVPAEIGDAQGLPAAVRARRSASILRRDGAPVLTSEPTTAPPKETSTTQAAPPTPPATQARRSRAFQSTSASASAAAAEAVAGQQDEATRAAPPSTHDLRSSQRPLQQSLARGRMTISGLLGNEGYATNPETVAAAPEASAGRQATRIQQPTARGMRLSPMVDTRQRAARKDAVPTVPVVVARVPAAASVSDVTMHDAPTATAAPPLTRGRRGRPRAATHEVASTVALDTIVPTAEAPGAVAVAPAVPTKRKYSRRKPVDETAVPEAGSAQQPVPRETRRRSMAAASALATAASAAEGVVDGDATAISSASAEPYSASAAKRPRRERSVTPEDAETRTVDHRELRMEDLTKDLRIGKKFSRHDELVDRLREKRRKYRRERLLGKRVQQEGSGVSRSESVLDSENGGELGGAGAAVSSAAAVVGGGGGGGGASFSTLAGAAAATVLAAMGSNAGEASSSSGGGGGSGITGPQFEIVDGAIVVNQASLVHDRHAAAAAEQGELEEVEENDFTRQTTSNTYLKPGKLRGPNAWTEAETELFYRALSMFGTSFDLICRWFPGKSRRHIKMKFNREDKLHTERITQALVGQNKVAIDVDEYIARTGQTLHATETIASEYAEREAAHAAEQQRIVDEQAEALRQKRVALFGPRNGLGEGSTGAGAEAATDERGGASATGPAGAVRTVDENGMEIIDETDLPPATTRGRRKGLRRGRP